MNRVLRFVIIVAVVGGLAYQRAQRRRGATSPAVPSLPSQVATAASLTAARQAFQSHLLQHPREGSPPAVPPAGVFELVRYPATPGAMSAYLTPDPKDGHRHPAIVWITGGDCNSIGEVWGPAERSNDQSAAAYRQAGIAMMFPSLRGGNDSPGSQEKFLGETDDVIAAADYLAKQPWVDPARIYLGGHSTGGTLALLVAESTDRFRAVFSFGPVAAINTYGEGLGPWPFNIDDDREVAVRSPGLWLGSIHMPTFVLEGDGRGNASSVKRMQSLAGNMPALHWAIVPGKTHFTLLAPANEVLAKKILADTGATCNVDMTAADVAKIAAH